MNPIVVLKSMIEWVFPKAKIDMLRPAGEGIFWSLDVDIDDYYIAIEWSANFGFFLTSNDSHCYGEGADEHYTEFPDAVLRTLDLIRHQKPTDPTQRLSKQTPEAVLS